jgi:hypothetical protein
MAQGNSGTVHPNGSPTNRQGEPQQVNANVRRDRWPSAAANLCPKPYVTMSEQSFNRGEIATPSYKRTSRYVCAIVSASLCKAGLLSKKLRRRLPDC